MRKTICARLGALAFMTMFLGSYGNAFADAGYNGKPRPFLWADSPIDYAETDTFKKDPPYIIGFSNASISNIWRVGLLHSVQKAAAEHSELIEKLIITDANDDPSKQVSDVQDLIQRDVDILIVSPATAQALDPVVTRAMQRGIPVVLVDRRVTSDNFVSFVTSSDFVIGRFMGQWIAEKLEGKGNVLMLGGIAGASPAELRIGAARSVFAEYPDINILDLQYTDWSPTKGKQVAAAMIQKYGDKIDAVWSDSGLQGFGSLEAFVDAGYKDGEIPPHTCADLNGCLKLAVEHHVPVFNFDNPPSMGAVSVQIALDILAGKPVPKKNLINVDLVVSEGDETASIKADKFAADYAQLDKPDELILSTGLGPDYDPTTFSVDYPK